MKRCICLEKKYPLVIMMLSLSPLTTEYCSSILEMFSPYTTAEFTPLLLLKCHFTAGFWWLVVPVILAS
jgi:hypothetical protein